MTQGFSSRRLALALMGSAALVAAGMAGAVLPQAAAAAQSEVVFALSPQQGPNFFFPEGSSAAFSQVNGQINHLMYLPLVNITHADTPSFTDAVAQKVTWNKSGTVYDVYIKPNLNWSDGKPVTAADVVFTWNVMKYSTNTKAPWTYGGEGMGGVPTLWKSVVAKGQKEVVVTLNKGVDANWFEIDGLSQIFPVPSFLWNKYPTNANQELKYILSVSNSPTNSIYKVIDGPYFFSAMVPNQYWSFVANPGYQAGRKPTVQKVVFEYETSNEAEFAALKSGTIQVGYLPFSLYGAKSELNGDTFDVVYDFGFNYILPNESAMAQNVKDAFQSVYVRQALEMGVNQKGIIQSFYDGYGVVEDDQVPSQPRTVFYDKQATTYSFNPAAGKKLLEAHGWKLVKGVMTKDGVALKFTFIFDSGNDTDESIAQYLKTTWAQEGIDVTLESEQDNTIFTYGNTDASKWSMLWWGGGWTYGPDFEPTGDVFFSPVAGVDTGYESNEMTKLIAATEAAGTQAQHLARFKQFLNYESQQMPLIWMPYYPLFFEVASNVKNVVSSFNPITGFYYPNYWTVSG
jgi:peptide/nickel transport system substrate-binding protein